MAVDRVGAEDERLGDLRVVQPAGDEENIAWTRKFWSALEPWSGGRVYFNFPGNHEEGDATLRASYGANYERLVDVKTKWDPENVFHTGQNIHPRR